MNYLGCIQIATDLYLKWQKQQLPVKKSEGFGHKISSKTIIWAVS